MDGTAGAVRGGRPPAAAMRAALRGIWSDGRRVERACYAVGGLLMLSGLVHLLVFAVDGGPWTGPVSWRKPVTFGLSFGLTLITIAWVSSSLDLGDRARRDELQDHVEREEQDGDPREDAGGPGAGDRGSGRIEGGVHGVSPCRDDEPRAATSTRPAKKSQVLETTE